MHATNLTTRLKDLAFYLLIALAAFSPPLAEVGGDYITFFDLFLGLYFLIKFLTTGFSVDRQHWKLLLAVFGLYLVYLVVSGLFTFSLYSLLLAAKHVEYVVFLVLLLDRLCRTKGLNRDLIAVLVILTLVVLYQLLYTNGLLPGIGNPRRLGLPFMQGVSSNPAGFFLGALLVVLFHTANGDRTTTIVALPLAILAVWALLLTISRTNILALGFVLVLSVVWIAWRSAHRWLLLTGMVVAAGILYVVVVPRLPTDGTLGRVVRILQDPTQIFRESSFRVRLEELWVKGFETWLTNVWTFLFGGGLGIHERIDGTIPRLLGGQGVVGLVFFSYVWFVHYLWRERSAAIIFLFIFVIINGINAETLVVSYRTVQLYLVILFIALSAARIRATSSGISEAPSERAVFGSSSLLQVARVRWPLLVVPVAVAVTVALFTGAPKSATNTNPALQFALFSGAGLLVGLILAVVGDYFMRRIQFSGGAGTESR